MALSLTELRTMLDQQKEDTGAEDVDVDRLMALVTDRAQKRAEHDRLWDDEIKAEESAQLRAELGWTVA